MTIPTFNVGGLASGLDTNSIISQLMDLERIPLRQLQTKQALYEYKDAAWQQISTRLSSLHTAIGAIDSQADWTKLVTASSSNSDAVSATATGAAGGSLAFTVDRLATSHQIAGTTSFGSASDTVGAGTFTVTVDGTDYDITTNDTTTVADLASQINSLDVGVSAAAVSIDATTVKLVLTSVDTGDAAAFTASGTQASLTTFSIVQQALDAQLTIGSGAGALTVFRSSNTVTDLMSGVTLNLKSTTASAVTVSAGKDVDTAVEKVRAFVNELNSTLTAISEATKYNATSKKAGVLQGDSTARSILIGLRSQVSAAVDGLTGPYSYAAGVGVSVNRDGTFTLNESALRDALDDDFGAVTNLFTRSGTSTDTRVSFSSASADTVDGTYAVIVTQAASVASVTGSAYAAPGTPEAFQITSGGIIVDVTIDPTDDLTAAVGKINTALSAAGVTTVSATEDGGAIRLDESQYGSGSTFTVSANSFGLAGTHAGTNVAGTIGGEAASGSGRYLTATAGDPTDLSIKISASQTEVDGAGGSLAAGSVTTTTGFMKRLEEYLDTLEGVDGAVERARDRWQTQIDYVDDRIVDMEIRLEQREITLRRQYTALERAMSQMSGLAAAMSAALAGLSQSQN